MACRVVKEDELPLTLVAREVEGYLLEGNHWMVVVEREAEVDDPSVVLGSPEVAEVVPPCHDASRDAGDDERLDETPRSNSASEVVPMEARRRTVDEVYRLDLADFEQLTIVPPHFRVFLPWRRV